MKMIKKNILSKKKIIFEENQNFIKKYRKNENKYKRKATKITKFPSKNKILKFKKI